MLGGSRGREQEEQEGARGSKREQEGARGSKREQEGARGSKREQEEQEEQEGESRVGKNSWKWKEKTERKPQNAHTSDVNQSRKIKI